MSEKNSASRAPRRHTSESGDTSRAAARRVAAGAMAIAALFGAAVLLTGCGGKQKSRDALGELLTEGAKLVETDYTADSYAAYKEAYDRAMRAYQDKKSRKELLDNCKKGMEDAKDALVRRANFSALNDLLAQDFPEENYTTESYARYRTAWEKAKTVSDATDSKQSVVNSARDVLQKAIDALQKKADISRLSSLVMELVPEAEYTSASYAAYLSVYNEARDLYNQYDEDMSEEQAKEYEQNVSICLVELDAAIAGLERRGDLSALRTLYEKALAVYTTPSEQTSGYAPAQYYSPASYSALGTALDEALSVLNSGDFTQPQIDEVTAKLQAAFDALAKKTDTAELEGLILLAAKRYLGDPSAYEEAGYIALNDAVNAGKDLIADGKNPTDGEARAACTAILTAAAGLRPAAITPPTYSIDTLPLNCGSALTTAGTYLRDRGAFLASLAALPPETVTLTTAEDTTIALLPQGIRATFAPGRVALTFADGASAVTGDGRACAIGSLRLGSRFADVVSAMNGTPTELTLDESGNLLLVYRQGSGDPLTLTITLSLTDDTVKMIVLQ